MAGNQIAGGLGGAGSGAIAGTAIAPGIGTAIGAGVGGLAGWLGAGSGDDLDDEAKQQLIDANNAIKGVSVPDLAALKVKLQQYRSAGIFNPQLEQAVQIGDSQMQGVSADPRLKDMQMKALMNLSNQSNTGLTSQQTASLNAQRNDINRASQAQQNSILQQMQERGLGGSGNELASRMIASQQGANRAAEGGDRLAAMTNMQALQALSQQGSMAGQMRSQDVGEQEAKARAMDAWNQFKAQNTQGVMNANTGLANQGMMTNFQNAQNIANMNTGVANQQATQNASAAEQDYMNRLHKASGVAGADYGMAGYDANQAQQNRNGWGQAIGGVGAAGAAYGQYKNSNPQYDSKTGAALYNPQTGEQYGSKKTDYLTGNEKTTAMNQNDYNTGQA